MKKTLIYFNIIICTAFAFANGATAQQKVTPADVKKIILSGSDGGMTGGSSFELEVLNEHGKWNSYQTADDEVEQNRRPQTIQWADRIKIGSLSTQQISSFLNSIALIKSVLDPKALHITAPELIAGIKKIAKDTAANTIRLEQFITDVNVQQATQMRDISVDTYSQLRIDIVKTNNDTLKIETHNWYATMLPWMIGNVKTYDIAINEFFWAATCGRDYGYSFLLPLDRLKEDIYSYVDADHPDSPVETYLWNYCYTDTKKMLYDNFIVEWESAGVTRDHHFCSLKTKLMPSNISIYASVYLAEKQGIFDLVRYGELFNHYLKAGNFVFKYYAGRAQCFVSSSLSTLSVHRPNLYLADIQKHIPSLKSMNTDSVLHFSVSAPGEHSDWYLFPNNQLVMSSHYVDKDGTKFAPIFPADDTANPRGINVIKYTLFNADGTVVK